MPGTKRSRSIRDENTKLPSLNPCLVETLPPVSGATFDRHPRHPLEERAGPALPIPPRADPGAIRTTFGLALGPARTQMLPGGENDAARRKSPAIVPVECVGTKLLDTEFFARKLWPSRSISFQSSPACQLSHMCFSSYDNMRTISYQKNPNFGQMGRDKRIKVRV